MVGYQSKCDACNIEAEIGTIEVPHPVDRRLHTCFEAKNGDPWCLPDDNGYIACTHCRDTKTHEITEQKNKKSMSKISKVICNFVNKSGGVDQIRAVKNSITKIPDRERAALSRKLTENDNSARQLLAAAVLGFTIAEHVYDTFNEKPTHNKEELDGYE